MEERSLPVASGTLTSADDPLYQRTRILVGERGVERLRGARVLVAGLGGVGSYVAEALARAGIESLVLVDHDRVAASNLNRQLPALHSTLGEPKVAVMARRLRQINPQSRLVELDQFISVETCPELLASDLDLVVDAIDSLSCKVELIAQGLERKLPVLSSMGAGGRMDPTRVRVGDLMDTQVCPLARAVRTRIRRRGLGRGVEVVWSDEQPRPPLPPEDTGQGRPRAVNGTISYLPAIFGLTLAGLAIRRLLGEP